MPKGAAGHKKSPPLPRVKHGKEGEIFNLRCRCRNRIPSVFHGRKRGCFYGFFGCTPKTGLARKQSGCGYILPNSAEIAAMSLYSQLSIFCQKDIFGCSTEASVAQCAATI